MLTLLMILCGAQLSQGQMEIQQLNNNGVLFEPMGPALTYQTKWVVLTKLTIIHPEATLEFVRRCETTANKLCNLLKDQKENCNTWHKEITAMISKIEKQLEELDFYLGKSRKRRELFDGIGKLSKYLFGTMDSEDSQKIFNKLQNLEKHDDENMHLMEKQMTILKSSFDVTSKYIQNLTMHQNHLTEIVQNFTYRLASETGTMKQDIQSLKIQTEINHILLFVWTKLQLIHDHIGEQFTIINALHEHRLHPLLISAKQFNNTYNQITGSKTEYLSIKQFALLNQVVEVQSYEGDQGLGVKITIPLILNQQFTLEQIHLIPINHNNQKTTIVDLKTSFVLNGTQNQFIELTQYELMETCKRCITDNHVMVTICHQKQPKSLHANDKDCLASLLTHNEHKIINQCPHKIIDNEQDLLVKLFKKDAWLFSFKKARKVIAHCGKISTAKELTGIGILQLTKPCSYTLDTKEIPYEGSNEIITQFKQPEIQLPASFRIKTNLNTQLTDLKETLAMDVKVHTYQNNNKELLEQAKSINEFEKELNSIEQKRQLEKRTTQTNVNSGILGIISFVLVIIAIKQLPPMVRSCCCTKKNKGKTTITTKDRFIQPARSPTQSEPKQTLQIIPTITQPTIEANPNTQLQIRL